MSEELLEAKLAEAAHQAAVSHEATSNAREAQMHETLVKALREVLVDGNDEERPMLIKRIPFICRDILAINEKVSAINDNIKWGVRIVLGAVIIGVLTLLFKK